MVKLVKLKKMRSMLPLIVNFKFILYNLKNISVIILHNKFLKGVNL